MDLRLLNHWLYLVLAAGCTCRADPDVPLGFAPYELRPVRVIEEQSTNGIDISGIIAATISSDGLIFAGSSFSREIQIIDPEGETRGSFGRKGKGPGEFTQIGRMGWLKENVWVSDLVTNQVSIFSRQGSLVDSWQVPRKAGGQYPFIVEAVLGEDKVLGYIDQTRASSEHRPLQIRTYVIATRFDEAVSPLLSVRGPPPWTRLEGTGAARGRFDYIPNPFPHTTLVRYSAYDNTVLVTSRESAMTAATSWFHVVKIDMRGDTLWRTSVKYRPVSLDEREWGRRLADVHEPLQALGQRAMTRRSVAKAAVRAGAIPRFKPPVTAMAVGGDGRVWLRREERRRPEVIWLVLAPDGNPMAWIHIPKEVRLLHVSEDMAWGLQELDGSSQIVTYNIRPAKSP